MTKTKKVKWLASLIVLILLLSGCFNENNASVSNDENTINIDYLHLTQDDTFMSISSSDSDSFNRMIPFYFKYTSSFESDEEMITRLFNAYFDSVTIYFDDDFSVFTTSEISWTAGQDSPTEYNPILYIMIEVAELIMTDTLIVARIVFNRNDDYTFEISNFLIDAHTTISEDIFLMTSSPVMATIDENFEIYGTYSIFPVTGEEIHNFELIFPDDFSTIDGYEVIDININEEGVYEFRVQFSFLGNNDIIVFRPLIRIEYGTNQVSYMIPLMPVYID